MSPVAVVARWELRRLRRDPRVRLLGAVLAALVVLAALHGWRLTATLAAERSAAQALDHAQWLAQGGKHPHGAAHYGFYAFRPAGVFSILDAGVVPASGSTIWLEAHKQNEAKFRPLEQAGTLGRFAEPTAAWIMQVLVPLLVVLFGFAAISAEREQGTLRLLLGQGATPLTLLTGKALALGAIVALLVAPGALLAGCTAIAMAPAGGQIEAGLRIALWAGGYALYLGGMVLVTLAASALLTQRVAMLALMSFWIANGLLAPRLAAVIASATYPTPSAAAFATGINRDIPGHHDAQFAARLNEQTLARHGVRRIDELPFAISGYTLLEDERLRALAFDRHFAALHAVFAAQDWLRTAMGLALPALAVQVFSAELAGTGRGAQTDFARAAEAYRRDAMRRLNEDIARNAARDVDWDAVYRGNEALWRQIPPFSYEPPGLADAIADAAPALVVLLGWFALAVTVAGLSARNMRVL